MAMRKSWYVHKKIAVQEVSGSVAPTGKICYIFVSLGAC